MDDSSDRSKRNSKSGKKEKSLRRNRILSFFATTYKLFKMIFRKLKRKKRKKVNEKAAKSDRPRNKRAKLRDANPANPRPEKYADTPLFRNSMNENALCPEKQLEHNSASTPEAIDPVERIDCSIAEAGDLLRETPDQEPAIESAIDLAINGDSEMKGEFHHEITVADENDAGDFHEKDALSDMETMPEVKGALDDTSGTKVTPDHDYLSVVADPEGDDSEAEAASKLAVMNPINDGKESVDHQGPKAEVKKAMEEGFLWWLQHEANISKLSAVWNVTILKNLPKEFGLPTPEYDFYECYSRRELNNLVGTYAQVEYFEQYDKKFNGEIKKAIRRYSDYVKSVDSTISINRTNRQFAAPSDATIRRHTLELQKHIVYDNVVYIPASSSMYGILNTAAYHSGMNLADYIKYLGFERTQDRPIAQDDGSEADMAVRPSSDDFIVQAFDKYPLVGSMILSPEQRESVLQDAKKIIDEKLSNSSGRILPREKAILTLALIQYAKDWDPEDHSKFWVYINKQFGYRDKYEKIKKQLRDALETTLRRSNRLFIEDESRGWYRGTAVLHAFAPKKSWMAFFDFLFDFYKTNLNWTIVREDPLIEVMIQSLIQRFGADSSEENIDISISSKAYSFREGIRKLILLRPKYARSLAERLIRIIDSFINVRSEKITTYEEQLCQEWFEGKLAEISRSTKTKRTRNSEPSEVILDYSKIRAKYRLKNETELQIVLPEVRLLYGTSSDLTIKIYNDGTLIESYSAEWYGNELGRTLKSQVIKLSNLLKNCDSVRIQIRLLDGENCIFNSEERLYRNRIIFNGQNEVIDQRIIPGNYMIFLPSSEQIQVERGESPTPISAHQVANFQAFFLELRAGFIVWIGSKIAYFDRSETDTEFYIRSPKESESLPRYIANEEDFELANRTSSCQIVLSHPENAKRYVLQKDRKRVDLSTLESDEEKRFYFLPLENEMDICRIQVLDLSEENLLFQRNFLFVEKVDCEFNREFYFSQEDFREASVKVHVDNILEEVDFSMEDDFVSLSFRDGELQIPVPKVTLTETTGEWLDHSASAWFIKQIPQGSQLKITKPSDVLAEILIGEEKILFDRDGIIKIGNKLHSLTSVQNIPSIKLQVLLKGNREHHVYPLARIFLKEGFLNRPKLWEENHLLYWDKGGAFIGQSNTKFKLTLTMDSHEPMNFDLDLDNDFIPLPESTPEGEYNFTISAVFPNVFKREVKEIAGGRCIIGDRNLLRFQNRRIQISKITDEYKIVEIHPCYIEGLEFKGIEETSEGRCPVYSGTLYRNIFKNRNKIEKTPYSFQQMTDEKGVVYEKINPVKIIYIGETTLSITNELDDGICYRKTYDDFTNTEYALTDQEPNEKNKAHYSLVDLYLYTTERM